MNLSQPQRPTMFVFSVPSVTSISSFRRSHDAKTFARPVSVLESPPKVVVPGLASFIDQLAPHLVVCGFGLFLLPLGRPPSLPFSRAAFLLALLVILPLQAGQ